MPLLVKKRASRKPPHWRPYDLQHPTLEHCVSWLPLLNGAGTYLNDPFHLVTQNADFVDVDWKVTRAGDVGIDATGLPDQAILWPSDQNVWGDLTSDEFSLYVELFIRGWGENNNGHIVQNSPTQSQGLTIGYEQGVSGLRWARAATIGNPSNATFTWSPLSLSVDGRLHKWLFSQRDGDGSNLFFCQDLGSIEKTSNIYYLGSAPGDKYLVFLSRSNLSRTANSTLLQVRLFDRFLDDDQVQALFDDPWGVFDRIIWVPVQAPSGEVNLNINDLRHGRLVDDVDIVVESADLNIQDLRHARPVDEVDVVIQAITLVVDNLRHGRRVDELTLTVDAPLFLADMRHGRRVDELLLEPTEEAAADDLRHARPVDGVDVTALLGVTLDIAEARHARPVDALLLDVDQPIIVEGLRHARPIDAPAVSPLLGDSTAVESTAAVWRLNAGLPLDNPNGGDLGWHVIDGVFNGASSSIGVDGARIAGDAGVRDLVGLTVGADVDGNNRAHGQLAELRIYAGELTTAERDAIISEMTERWITG